MNTKLIAIAAIAIILLAGGGLFLYNQSNKQSSPTQTASNNTSATPQALKNSIFDILASGQSQECSFDSKVDENSSSKGVFYITQDKMRGDITTSNNGKASDISIIRVGEDNYMWGTDLAIGIKMKLSLEDLKSNDQASSYVDLNQDFDYKCKGWTVDNSKFTPPSNIKFTDLSAFMPGSSSGSPSGFQINAGACASITDANTRAACEKALSGQ